MLAGKKGVAWRVSAVSSAQQDGASPEAKKSQGEQDGGQTWEGERGVHFTVANRKVLQQRTDAKEGSWGCWDKKGEGLSGTQASLGLLLGWDRPSAAACFLPSMGSLK